VSVSIEMKENLRSLTIELLNDYDREYVVFAMKKLNEQQMLGMHIPVKWERFDPHLKVLDLIGKELSTAIFSDESAVLDDADLIEIISYLIEFIGTHTDKDSG
jgi:hypothetical protein